MTYTKEQQESDRSFLVGASYGRDTERAWWERAVSQATSLDHLLNLMENR